ncbi:Arginine--tRNA ligase, partial [Bienertia sinuspersici]
MEGLGIKKFFIFPHIERLVEKTINYNSDHFFPSFCGRAEKLFSEEFDLRVHPDDIQAAEFGGALAVGVCIGFFRKEELKQASDTIILQDIS